MALWGLGIWCAFILTKLASWIVLLKYAVKRLFDYLLDENANSDAKKILSYFEEHKLTSTHTTELFSLLDCIRSYAYISSTDIKKATEAIKKSKEVQL